MIEISIISITDCEVANIPNQLSKKRKRNYFLVDLIDIFLSFLGRKQIFKETWVGSFQEAKTFFTDKHLVKEKKCLCSIF